MVTLYCEIYLFLFYKFYLFKVLLINYDEINLLLPALIGLNSFASQSHSKLCSFDLNEF